MYPLHKEKFYLTGDTFHTFMRDRLEKDINKEKNSYKIMAGIMFFITAIIIGILITGYNGVNNDLVWMAMPVLTFVIGLTNIKKIKQAEDGLNKKIIKDYTDHEYEKYQVEVKFFEDKLVMKHKEKETEIQYITFRKYYEAEKYFAIYFTTGEIVIFNGNCKKDKIKEIIGGYIENVKAGE